MIAGTLSIKLRCASWQQLATIYKRDLSKGTMFLKATAPPPVGTAVRIDLTLPSASVIVLNGVVQLQVNDPQRGTGVELKLAPIPTGSIWLIESALASEKRPRSTGVAPGSPTTPASGVPVAQPHVASAPVASVADGEDVASAEADLIRALLAEAESLKKLNPFLVLGIGYEAGDGDVRAAFGALTKRYHPDRFARYESPELRAVAAEIFILIRDAYRRLVDDRGRTAVLATLGRGASAPRSIPAPRPTGATGAPPLNNGALATPPAQRPSAQRLATAQIPVLRPATSGVPATRPHGEPRQPPPRPPSADPMVSTARPLGSPPAAGGAPSSGDSTEILALESLLDAGRLDEARAGFKTLAKKHPHDRTLRAGIELCEGLLALNLRDRLEAAQRFETALEIDPSNERAARELADMRRQATNERKGLLSRLMGKRDD